MSAPWEVWVLTNKVTGKVSGFSTEKENGAFDNDHRYLRADLTCGECAHLKEDSVYSILCTKHSWEIAAENPACMAFVLRVEK